MSVTDAIYSFYIVTNIQPTASNPYPNIQPVAVGLDSLASIPNLTFVRLLCHLTQHQQIPTQLTSLSTDCSSSLLLNYRAFAYPDFCFRRQKLTLILDIINRGRLTALLGATEDKVPGQGSTTPNW